MMRITDKMGSLTANLNLAKLRADMDIRQREASTGLRVSEASDDPTAATAAMRYDSDREVASQCRENLDSALGELTAADTALDQVSELLIRAKEISISMANGNIGAAERDSAAIVVSKLRSEVIALGNTKHNGYYIFSGYSTDTAAFDSTGSFQGDDNVRHIWATDSLKVEASISGAQAFTTSGGTDVLTSLANLATALDNNNITGIRTGLDTMDACLKQVLSSRTTAGAHAARVIELESMMDTREFELKRNRSNVADAEMTETLSELARAQQALTYTVQIAARVISAVTLVDKL